MVAVQRTARGGTQFPRIDLDLSAFLDAKPGKHVFDMPNLADAENVPGELFIIAYSDGFESSEAQASAMVRSIMNFFPDLGRFMQKLSLFDWLDIINAWREESQKAMSVDPKASSSSTSS
jgi:hypothetical protein